MLLPDFTCKSLPCIAVTLLVVLSSASGGTVSGHVDIPEPARLRKQSRQYAAPGQETAQERPEPRSVIYLENTSTADLPLNATADLQLRQEGLQFIPPLLPVQVGATVRFPNLDSTYHNVFSYSPARNFDLGRYKKGESPPEITFTNPGIVQVFCEVHEHMRATILVLETPYFTTTDVEGNFSLSGIPAGRYTLTVWHSPRNQERIEVEISESEPLILDLAAEKQ